MKKYYAAKISLIIIIYFIVYFIISILRLNFLEDILAPVGDVLSFIIIFNTYLKIKRPFGIGNIWLTLSLACMSWSIADILWALYDILLHKNPGTSNLISSFYMLTNVLLFISVLTYLLYQFRKWNAIQLITDSVIISVTLSLTFWILFFDKSFKTIEIINKNGIISVVNSIIDFSSLISLVIWFCSIRKGKIPSFVIVIAGSVSIYFISDIYWIYLNANNLYVPGSISDVLYMSSLLGIAIAAELRRNGHYRGTELYNYSNAGLHHKGILLLLCPLLVTVFKGFDIVCIIVFISIYVIYESLTIYIQSSIKNVELLKKEKNINIELEKRIKERTKELVKKNKELKFLSNQDTVTNLYNRRYFINSIEKKISQTADNKTLSLLFIDVDRFKTINDTYGHNIGDKVLIELSKRLEKLRNKNSILARLGGDEFVFAVYSDNGYCDMEKLAEEMIKCCSRPFDVYQYSFKISISIGISIYPIDAKNSETLMKNADIAMYQAKKLGYNKYVSFNTGLSSAIKRKNEIEILLKKADLDKEFKLFYQPQFRISDKKLIGMEALIRWNNLVVGTVSPSEFIPIAEETDCIIPIGDWVMNKAAATIAKWNRLYNINLKMGINVSPKQIDQVNFIGKLNMLIEKYCISPEWLDIEITEGVAIEGYYGLSKIAEQFRDTGVSISIDDFGTGYSSLSYLKYLPFGRIKIAKQLIDTITEYGYDSNIVKFVILLSKSLGIRTIAEGVENEDQYKILYNLGCDEIQGYYLGKPISKLEFEKTFLKNKNNTEL